MSIELVKVRTILSLIQIKSDHDMSVLPNFFGVNPPFFVSVDFSSSSTG